MSFQSEVVQMLAGMGGAWRQGGEAHQWYPRMVEETASCYLYRYVSGDG